MAGRRNRERGGSESSPDRPKPAACTKPGQWSKFPPLHRTGRNSMRMVHIKLATALLASVALVAQAQAQASYPCVNDAPNPYKLQSNWAQTPRPWGPTNAVTVDSKDNIWVFDRCGDEGCSKSNASPIFHLGPDGKTIKNFGAGEFASAHGIAVDKDGNVWAADFQTKDGKGQQVVKFSPDGKVLLKLGKAGESGMGDDTFNQPSGLAVLSTGEILVAEGHGSKLNKSRVDVYSKDGKFLRSFASHGTGDRSEEHTSELQ